MDKRFYFLLLLSVVVFTANIWGTSIYILDEAKNATCAVEMFERGDWVVPTFNQELRTDKPPLHYYAMMLAFQLFGISEWTARIFSALCGVGTVAITYAFTKRHLGASAAFYAGLVLTSSLQIAVQFHLAVPDPYLIFFTTLGYFAFFTGYHEKKPVFLYLAYGAIGLAMLAKGPVAIVLPGAVAFSYLLASGAFRWKSVLSLRPFSGLLLIACIAAPWYILVAQQTQGAWPEGFFLKHNIARFTESMEGHSGPFFLPLVFVFTGLFPSAVFLPQAVKEAWNSKRQIPILHYALWVVTITVVFFAISRTKLPSYPATCFPIAAMLVGYFLQKAFAAYPRRLKAGFWAYLVLALALPVGAYLGIQADPGIGHLKELAFFFLPATAGAVLALWWYRGHAQNAYFALAGSFVVTTLLFFYVVFPPIDQLNPVQAALRQISLHEKALVSYQRFNPAFAFYARQPIAKLPNHQALLQAAKQQPGLVILAQPKSLSELDSLYGFKVWFYQQDLFELRKSVILLPGSANVTAPRRLSEKRFSSK